MENVLYYERLLGNHYTKFYFNRKVDSYNNIAKVKEKLDKLSEEDFALFVECVKFYEKFPFFHYSITDLALKVFPTFNKGFIEDWKLFEKIFLLEKENNAWQLEKSVVLYKRS